MIKVTECWSNDNDNKYNSNWFIVVNHKIINSLRIKKKLNHSVLYNEHKNKIVQ